MEQDVLQYDVVVVGGGISGLTFAINLKQLRSDLSIAVLEKGSSIGAHNISGAVFNPVILNKLIPNWKDVLKLDYTSVKTDINSFMTKTASYKLPTPKSWRNNGNIILSASKLCRALGEYAESIGIEIYPGFAVDIPKFVVNGNIKKLNSVITGKMGVGKNGEPKDTFQEGIEIKAHQFIIAEGCRGSFGAQVIEEFNLNNPKSFMSYGLGIKEVWEVDSKYHEEGKVEHFIGYPLNNKAYGGGFIYHMSNNKISVGLITGLDYQNPYINPYEEFQQFKNHPQIKIILKSGKPLEYGARTIVESGITSLPTLGFNGGLIIGDSAGFLNVAKIKGLHNAMYSAILASETIAENIDQITENLTTIYSNKFKASWLYKDLMEVRNIRPSFKFGLIPGILYSALDGFIFKGKTPWTFKFNKSDAHSTKKSSNYNKIKYQRHDNVVSFDIATSLQRANLSHEEDQRVHLVLVNKNEKNYEAYNFMETRFCPAKVYEINTVDNKRIYTINSQNCLHCKSCDIKSASEGIKWTLPEGASGPQYSEL